MENTNEGVHAWKKALGGQIRDYRRKAGLTQDGLGKAIGVSKNMIGRYEAGTDVPSMDRLGSIALRLDMQAINVNGHSFSVSPRPTSTTSPPEQLQLEFGKEYVYYGAGIKITPTRATITVTAIAPLKIA